MVSDWIETSLDAYRDVRDHMSEAPFHAIYGSPLLQALVGLKASDASPRRRPGKDAAHRRSGRATDRRAEGEHIPRAGRARR